MSTLKDIEFGFDSKLRQESTIERLKEYILWQRNSELKDTDQRIPDYGPISINLDLTTACNFSCLHCVDSSIINTGQYLRLENIKQTINVLRSHGLLSVILLGGGEPTLHNDFEEIVGYIKSKGIQVGIVTNGSRLDKVFNIAELLERKDWVRISIDAASEDTFNRLHCTDNDITLNHILQKAKEIKKINPLVSMGYSFVIIWDGIEINGNMLVQNTDEISKAAKLAEEYSFDYVSFKPCLVRLEDSQKESLLVDGDRDKEEKIIEEIVFDIQQITNTLNDKIKVLQSVNLQALLNKTVNQLKKQPEKCHMQFFRTVYASSGIYHCPAYRGVEKAKIAECDGYVSKSKFDESLDAVARSISTFDAEEECEVVACFYHHVNWWLTNFTKSNADIAQIEKIKDDNFFL